MVEPRRIELPTSALRTRRSLNWILLVYLERLEVTKADAHIKKVQ